jgi:hypothetical protein
VTKEFDYMSRNSRLTWLDGLFIGTDIPYPIIFLFFGFLIFMAYLFLGRMIEWEWSPNDKISFIQTGFLIAYQLSGIQYLLDNFRKILSDLSLMSADIDEDFCTAVVNRFTDSLWYFILLAIVILPFYLADWISSDYTLKENYTLMEQFIPAYLQDSSFWIGASDIYQDLVGFLTLFLLGYILWIIFNIALALRSASSRIIGLSLDVSIFSIQTKLRPIKNSLLGILFYYFICISLLILNLGLAGYLFEKVTLLALLLAGLIFFFIGYQSLNEIVEHQNDFEMDQINKKNMEYTKKLLAIDSNGDYGQKIQETNFISSMLEVLQTQRASLKEANTKVYDLRSILSIISAFILPILTDIAKKNLNLILASGDIANQGLSIIYSLFHRII